MASVRLAQVYGVRHARTALELYRRSALRVSQGNEVFRDYDQVEVVMDHMAVIDASLANESPAPLPDALHEAEMADCLEQITDEVFREKLRRGEASPQDGEDYIRKSAFARHTAERAERAVRQWINERSA